MAAPQKKKLAKSDLFVSPAGTAAFAWLHKPDEKFGDAKFKVTLLLDKTDEVREFLKKVAKFDKKLIKDGDKDKKARDEFKGKYNITFKSKLPPTLVDAKRKPLPANIKVFSGDVIKVAFVLGEYEGFGGGWTPYLNAVQLIKKVNNGRDYANAFGEEDGFEAGGDDAPATEDGDPGFDGSDQPGEADDLDF